MSLTIDIQSCLALAAIGGRVRRARCTCKNLGISVCSHPQCESRVVRVHPNVVARRIKSFATKEIHEYAVIFVKHCAVKSESAVGLPVELNTAVATIARVHVYNANDGLERLPQSR